jgi:hypothetical protein
MPDQSRHASPGHPDESDRHADNQTSQPSGEQSEDEFSPTAQEVAKTLAAMRSRRHESEDRGYEVGGEDSDGTGGVVDSFCSASDPQHSTTRHAYPGATDNWNRK